MDNSVVITGYGSLSSISNGSEFSLAYDYEPSESPFYVDEASYRPYLMHRQQKYDAIEQIEKRTTLKGMSESQRAATYSAGVALDMAGLKNKVQILENTSLITACKGGYRDPDLEKSIHLGKSWGKDAVSEMQLTHDLGTMRPSLFLTQLPNLFSANISKCFGVIGESMTFIGGKQAGSNALITAFRRIQSGQDDVALVGGAYDADDHYYHLACAASMNLQKERYCPINQREDNEKILGSAASFLVLESESHAKERGANPCGYLRNVCSKRVNPVLGGRKSSVYYDLWSEIISDLKSRSVGCLMTADSKHFLFEEFEYLKNISKKDIDIYCRATSNVLGAIEEASFITSITLALESLKTNTLCGRTCNSSNEREFRSSSLESIVVSQADNTRSINMALVEAGNVNE